MTDGNNQRRIRTPLEVSIKAGCGLGLLIVVGSAVWVIFVNSFSAQFGDQCDKNDLGINFLSAFNSVILGWLAFVILGYLGWWLVALTRRIRAILAYLWVFLWGAVLVATSWLYVVWQISLIMAGNEDALYYYCPGGRPASWPSWLPLLEHLWLK